MVESSPATGLAQPPMIEALFVVKRFATYADVFLMLGLARIAEDALRSTKQPVGMQLVDEGTRYRIHFKKPVHLDPIPKLAYTDPFQPVCGKKTDRSKITPETAIFDAVFHTQARKLYRDYLFQSRRKPNLGEESPMPPDPKTQNGAILVSMRHDKNHNELWQAGHSLRDKYGVLVASLLEAFSKANYSSLNQDIKTAAELFKQRAGSKLPAPASAVKIYLPTAIEGVSRVKADGNQYGRKNEDWLLLWLIANGLFHFGVSEKLKVAENKYDWRVVALQPVDIRLDKYREVLNSLRRHNSPGGGHGISRFDAELVLCFCQELLKNHESGAIGQPEDDLDIEQPVNKFVRGWAGTHFNQKGQVYGVKEIFTLGLPTWIRPSNSSELQKFEGLVKEHLSVVR